MKSSYCLEVIITFGNCPGVIHKKVMSRGINEHYPHLLGCTERDIYSVDDVQGCTWNQVFCPKCCPVDHRKVVSRGINENYPHL